MIHSRVYQGDQLLCDLPLPDLSRLTSDPKARIWIDLEGADDKQVSEIAGWFGIGHLTVEDIIEQEQRAKFEEGEGYYYLVMHTIHYDPKTDVVKLPELDVVFNEHFLLTVHDAPMPFITKLIPHDPNELRPLRRGIDFLLHAVADAVVDSYFPVLDELDDVLDQLEDSVIDNPTPDLQVRIFKLKRGLGQFRRVVSPQIEHFNRLGGRVFHIVSDEASLYFRDVHDHLVRVFEVVDSYRDLMSGMLDAYLSTVSNRLNDVMKRLTIIATIFLPITFITGIFGQNFGHSPQVDHDNGYFFWVVLGFMLLVSMSQILYFRWKHWM
ncbi:MAG TPA: magnesium/cobalt transporter CorA [Ktedonobacterales bacterium]|jgi:magnesium transporter